MDIDNVENIVPSSDELYYLCQAMRRYGGDFVKSLSVCMTYADTPNLKKLIATFPEYVQNYSSHAKRMWKEDEAHKKQYPF